MRQLCCHPGLIKAMLDKDSLAHEVIDQSGEDDSPAPSRWRASV